MTMPQDANTDVEQLWRTVLTEGHRSRLAVFPGGPRCLGCQVPVGGLGGTVLHPFGKGIPSRKNPNFCNLCDDVLPRGGAEVDIAVLFADVRGSTALGEKLGPRAFADLMNRFYDTATHALVEHNAMIDKMLGDEVMALFLPVIGEHRLQCVLAAEHLLRGLGYGRNAEPWLDVGISVHAGPAYVGKIGTEGVSDFTALGDTINTAARLQAEAKPGQIIISEDLYRDVADRYPNVERRVLNVRGRDEAIAVRVIEPTVPAAR